VNGGILRVDGDISQSSLTTVNAGGALFGAGIVGNTVIATGGIYAPGDGISLTAINSRPRSEGWWRVARCHLSRAGHESGVTKRALAGYLGREEGQTLQPNVTNTCCGA